MPTVTVSEDLYERVSEFKRVIEAVLEEPVDLNTCIANILSQGIDSMLRDLIGSADQEILIKSFRQLGALHPRQVYTFVAETLLKGKEVQGRGTLKRKIGFHKENQ